MFFPLFHKVTRYLYFPLRHPRLLIMQSPRSPSLDSESSKSSSLSATDWNLSLISTWKASPCKRLIQLYSLHENYFIPFSLKIKIRFTSYLSIIPFYVCFVRHIWYKASLAFCLDLHCVLYRPFFVFFSSFGKTCSLYTYNEHTQNSLTYHVHFSFTALHTFILVITRFYPKNENVYWLDESFCSQENMEILLKRFHTARRRKIANLRNFIYFAKSDHCAKIVSEKWRDDGGGYSSPPS